MKAQSKTLKIYLLLRSALFSSLVCAVAAGIRAGAQPVSEPAANSAGAATVPVHLWKPAAAGQAEAARQRLKLRPGKGHVLKLDTPALERALAHCPREFTVEARSQPVHVSLPIPDGSFQRFAVVESPVMAPELAAKFPQIKTYSGQGLDDPTAMFRFSV